MLMAETMTRDQAPPTTVAEPPLWPIVLAAVVAIAAGVVAVVLAL